MTSGVVGALLRHRGGRAAGLLVLFFLPRATIKRCLKIEGRAAWDMSGASAVSAKGSIRLR